MNLRTHRLTPGARATAFGVWFGSVSDKPPRRSSALPPRRPTPGLHPNAFRGEPAISGFAWHFTANRRSSGPFATDPGAALHRRVPPASAWPRLDHPVSGRPRTTRALFGLAFAAAPPVPGLTSPPGFTRRLILQKARRHPGRLPHPGSDRPEAHGFRFSFTPLAGVLFTVPSRYWSTIGRRRYLALGRGRPRFSPDTSCPDLLTIPGHGRCAVVAYGSLTLCGPPFQRGSADCSSPPRGRCRALHQTRPTPTRHRRQAVPPDRFGLLPVRSPLLRESFLVLGVLRCFSSPGAPPETSRPPGARPCAGRVAPFGYPWITGCQRLPRACRRVAASFLGRQRLGIPHALYSAVAHRISSHASSSKRLLDRRAPAGDESPRSPPGRTGAVPSGRMRPCPDRLRPPAPRGLHRAGARRNLAAVRSSRLINSFSA
jgi:hypothetical protein